MGEAAPKQRARRGKSHPKDDDAVVALGYE
jgi:hypothetical protein